MHTSLKHSSAIIAGLLCTTALNATFAAESFSEALTTGKAYVDVRMRYETVDQGNALKDADSLTLRTRLGYKTSEYGGLSAVIEGEDSRTVLGIDDFSVPPSGFNSGVFSVIADPETTELDQAFVQYKSGGFAGKLGRQAITFDNHRFVGHVGFRQDRQTFDALTLSYTDGNSLNIQLSQLAKRNRIFAEDRDIDSADTLLNVSHKTRLGKFTGYVYLLEEDNAAKTSNDTFGVRFNGSSKSGDTKFLYTAEFATQESNNLIDTDYIFLAGGAEISGITAKLGFESLGSDNGAGAFNTPLATLHKFNGWTDQFLSTPSKGLDDLYISLSGKLAGGKLTAIYHDFSSDVSAIDGDDLGDEINLVYARKFGDHYSAGAKYGDYSAGKASFGKVDTRKLWLWAAASF